MVSDSGWNAIAWIALAVLSFASSAIIFRLTGQASYGIWATIGSLRAFVMFLDGGLALGVARDAALADTERIRALGQLAAARRLYIVLGSVAMVAGFLAMDLPGALLNLEGPERTTARLITVLLGMDTGIALALSPLTAMLRGRRHFKSLAMGAVSQATVGILLIVILTPLLGLVGSALAILTARVVTTLAYLVWVRLLEPGLLQGTGGGWHVRVLRFAAPVWVIAFGTQLGLGTDVPIIGATYGAAAASAYALGSLLPATAAGFLFVVIDATFPRLAAADRASLVRQIPRLMFVGTLLGALGFTALALSGPAVITTWVGTAPGLSLAVLTIYAGSRVLNVPTHVLSMAAIARDRHTILAPLVIGEAVVSVTLSVWLAVTWSPLGPAVATFATLAISNLVVIPGLLIRKLHLRSITVALAALAGTTIGLLGALGVHAVASQFARPLTQTVIGALLTVALSGSVVAVFLLSPRRRLTYLLIHGGMGVVIREGWEQFSARRLLRNARSVPIIWRQTEEPLVSVRIATYNRGPLVAERAIASAQRQTHKNIEIVVVGDNCDAETERAVLGVRDRRVRFENLSQRGDYPDDPEHRWMVAGTAPMNRALDIIRGDWIAPLDDDDEFTDDHVEALLDACRTRDLEFAYGIANMENADGTWTPVGSWPLSRGEIIHAAVLYSSRLRVFRHSGDSWRLAEPADWNLWRRMKAAGVRMGFVPTIVCRHYEERRGVPDPVRLLP